MEDLATLGSHPHELGVDLIRSESSFAGFVFLFLAHAGPNIGVDEVGILDHRAYVVALVEIQIAHESHLFDKIVGDLVLFWASQTESKSTHRCGTNQ